MIMKLVIALITASFAAGEPQAICPNQTIEAVEGENVDLQCYLDPWANVENYAVDWKRLDLNKVVYSYRHRQENHQAQMDQYRGRASLNHEDLSRGIMTLHISSVQLSDSGPYRCFVSKLMTRCNTTLIVKTKRDGSTTAGPPVDDVTVPNDHDAAKMKTVWVASVCGVAAFAAAAAAAAVLVKLCVCKKTAKGLKGQEEEMMPDNYEMENLRT
ncbi:myelin-oligodendrocyte glycoprotein-like isoform X1 [Chelmon rostratus]|uniref:myelin-oligodendrocyte glycoprotein-like isoform X1 n=1 Tax=Chelmon rostratus TaxID=109905 RepID=UPI001BEABEBC|nr:myelin-oligodendrocyte glycoprotein-like isoform X1 [Chelmon rostratus]